MMEMDLRHFDAAIGRWVVIDPITHHSMSTYNGFDNNPVYFADPSGADGISVAEGTYTGQAAQDIFSQLQSQYGERSDEECCGNDGDPLSEGNGHKRMSGNKNIPIPIGNSSPTGKTEDWTIALCPKCPNKDLRKMAVMMAQHIGGTPQEFYDIMEDDNFVPNRISSNVSNLFGIAGAPIIGNAFKGAGKNAIREVAKNSPKLLLQRFNSVESLIQAAGKLQRLKGGLRQGTIQGNADDIFKGLVKQYGGTVQTAGREAFFKSGNIRVGLHKAAKGGGTPTIHINNAGSLFKIRVTQ